MIGKYFSSTRHRAAQFTIGMSAADAQALCTEFNQGRDASKSDFAAFNGSVIFIIGPSRSAPLMAEPGNWIVKMPDGSFDVHADPDFCERFCPAAS